MSHVFTWICGYCDVTDHHESLLCSVAELRMCFRFCISVTLLFVVSRTTDQKIDAVKYTHIM